jgi:hypothetical protein
LRTKGRTFATMAVLAVVTLVGVGLGGGCAGESPAQEGELDVGEAVDSLQPPTCTGGTDVNGMALGPVAAGVTICGQGGTTWLCDAAGQWQFVGAACTAGNVPQAPTCSCSGGTDANGTDLGPVACNSNICGGGNKIWLCDASGQWQSAGANCSVGVGPTPPTVGCSGGSLADGTVLGLISANTTLCGGGYKTWLCTASLQWQYMGADCSVASCSNGVFDPGELETDCGGACLCAPGQFCVKGADCANGLCSSNLCSSDLCVANHVTCPVPSSPCQQVGICNPATGTCSAATNKANGTACSDGNACTQSDACQLGVCTGSNSVVCAAPDQCHTAGSCDPLTGVCTNPAKPNGTACDDGHACTQSDSCQAGACVGTTVAAGTVCRASTGACDAAETCNGASPDCPANALVAAGVVCRSSAGACDPAEVCDGSTVNCPVDGLSPVNTVCRLSGGQCDVAETCTGSSATCPADAKVAPGTVCRASAGVCDPAEVCNGSNTCPVDSLSPGSTVCRASVGACDADDKCTGSSATCPADAKVGAGTICRSSAGACDPAEVCDGSSTTCSANLLSPVNTTCRLSGGQCDVAETCTGATAACPADGYVASGTSCNDGNASTTGDVCTSGSCAGVNLCAGVTCAASDQCHTAGTCNTANGICSNPAKANGTACNDGNASTSSDVCTSGVCAGVNLCAGVTCVQSDQCHTVGTCNPANGICSNPVDNNYYPLGPCETGQPGECSLGDVYCSNGAFVCIPHQQPMPEVCGNMNDDNCDGQTDEGCIFWQDDGSSDSICQPSWSSCNNSGSSSPPGVSPHAACTAVGATAIVYDSCIPVGTYSGQKQCPNGYVATQVINHYACH